MKKKKALSVISVALALLVQLSVLSPMASAAEISLADQLNAALTLTDQNGTDLTTETNVAKDAAVTMNFTFKIPDDAVINAGDTYTIHVPNQIKLTALDGQTFDLNTGDEVTMATAKE